MSDPKANMPGENDMRDKKPSKPTCANGCHKPVQPPSKVLCKECLEKLDRKFTDLLAPQPEPAPPLSFLPSKDSPFLSVLEPKK